MAMAATVSGESGSGGRPMSVSDADLMALPSAFRAAFSSVPFRLFARSTPGASSSCKVHDFRSVRIDELPQHLLRLHGKRLDLQLHSLGHVGDLAARTVHRQTVHDACRPPHSPALYCAAERGRLRRLFHRPPAHLLVASESFLHPRYPWPYPSRGLSLPLLLKPSQVGGETQGLWRAGEC